MFDSNGKRFKVGDDFHKSVFGMCKVIEISSDGESMTARAYEGGDGLEYTQEELAEAFPETIIIRSWKELAQDALLVSNACNLSGVILSFARVVIEVRRRLEFEGNINTHVVNMHPVCIIYAQAISNITNCNNTGMLDLAFKWAEEQIKQQ